MDWYAMTNQAIEAEIGQRIKMMRLKKNMTQDKLARKSGLSRVAISRIERGQGSTLSSLVKILRALNLLQNIEELTPPRQLSPLEILRHSESLRKRASSTSNLQS